jgi:1-acyl-sn-glycerol-3-phosphate acyltransferase
VLPPRWFRRLVLAPAVVALTILVLGALPLALLVAGIVSPLIPGRWRPLRVLWMVVLWLCLESAALVVLLVLWVCSGFGARIRSPRFERAHYDLAEWLLKFLFAECQRVLKVEVAVEGPEPSHFSGRPLLVFSRHAGPGDSFLMAHALLSWYDREPRIVLKEALQWDPLVDTLLSRLPNRFIRPGGAGRDGGPTALEQVSELATGLDDDDALLIFPEGGNYTDRRRARAIAKLREKGMIAEAEKAEAMRHVLPPRPGGVGAALDAAPDADVVWVAHSGLDHVVTVADMWRALPLDTRITMRWWQVPADEVPHGEEERSEWLYAWWTRIDEWVGEQRDAREAASPPPRRTR